MSLISANAHGSTGSYEIANSLRFDGSNDYLTRTFSASSGTTVTFSFWVKRSKLGALQTLFGWSNGSTAAFGIDFLAADTLDFYDYSSSAYRARKTTSQVFRDVSSHYHIVCVIDTTNATAADRFRVYVNGSRVTSFSASTDPSLNLVTTIASSIAWSFGRQSGTGTYYLDGYISEVNFIDGQALDASYFGYTDATTGQWRPKKYTGTYGTNGFYLDFKDGSSTTTLGYDRSGNGNNWTLTNMVRSAGVTDCWMTDTPTNNYAVYNKLSTVTTATISNGALDQNASTVAIGGVGMTTGQWYWEVTSTGGTTTCGMYNTAATATTTVTTGTTKGFRFDASAGTFDWTSNGSTWTSIATGLTSGPYFVYTSTAASTTSSLNHGQRSFAYTPPTVYKALCTANLTSTTVTQSGSFTGNVNANGPSVWCNGTPETLTINGNAVTWGTHADRLANGFKIRTASTGYNSTGTNTWTSTVLSPELKSAFINQNAKAN